MRPSRNAFLGYTYQQSITFLLLAKMDVERQIDEMEMEATIDNNFDDVNLSASGNLIYCQIKDIDNIKFCDLSFEEHQIKIKNKPHKLSNNTNILFFKEIDIKPNDEFLNIPAYKKDNIYIISLSRQESIQRVENLYKNNERRKGIIDQYFSKKLDKRHLSIKKEDLPIIDIYNVQLLERTIDTGKKLLEFDNLLFIEGKPGVGKSHLVTCLAKQYENNLIYRFWVSNQDKDYDSRLIFRNFINNISKEIFQDYRPRTEKDIIEYFSITKRIIIIDGLDHVENYKPNELEFFISFIDKLKNNTKVIVLSRPLKKEIYWKKQQLANWNFDETCLVLDELYRITDYSIRKEIFKITNGYPILVRFVTEQYKHSGQIPSLGKLESTNDYYNEIISSVNTQSALSLFISSRSFIMKSEISLFLNDELVDIINEFIKDYPYLFEIKLNRISLFHDSLNTYLISKGINNTNRHSSIKQVVYQSLINEEKRFMSRLASFDLDKSMKLEIVRKYANMDCFCKIIEDCIDFEAIKSFYNQIRHFLPELEPEQLSVYNYYDLPLIISILERDHVSTVNEFLYTYVKCLLFNGYNDDDITSSEYLFSMYYYYKTKDAILLYNITADEHYDTENFYTNLEDKISEENNYFDLHNQPLQEEQLRNLLDNEPIFDSHEYIPHLLANIYIHNTEIEELKGFYRAIHTYTHIDKIQGIEALEKALVPFRNIDTHSARFFLPRAKNIILSLGTDAFPNEYLTYSLKDLILRNYHTGSFEVWRKVFNYIRLSLHQNRKIDLSNISYFFAMYHNRNDITVINISEALKVFEDKGLIDIETSLDIIIFTQNMSEKGIRGLLRDYIELHTPNTIIPLILKKYSIDDLQVTWFNLPKEHIDKFPDALFKYAMSKQLLHWNQYSQEIKFDEIENVFFSNRKSELIYILNLLKFKIMVKKDNPYIQELKTLKCYFSIDSSEKENKYTYDNEFRYNQGILDSDSVEFIKEKKLHVADISGYHDGYYSVFADIGVFKAYEKDLVKENVLLILRNAIIGRLQTIDEFANLFYFAGNLPKFMNEYNINVDYNKLHDSFIKFLRISLLDTTNRNNFK